MPVRLSVKEWATTWHLRSSTSNKIRSLRNSTADGRRKVNFIDLLQLLLSSCSHNCGTWPLDYHELHYPDTYNSKIKDILDKSIMLCRLKSSVTDVVSLGGQDPIVLALWHTPTSQKNGWSLLPHHRTVSNLASRRAWTLTQFPRTSAYSGLPRYVIN